MIDVVVSGSIFTVTGTINNFKCAFYPDPWKQLEMLILLGELLLLRHTYRHLKNHLKSRVQIQNSDLAFSHMFSSNGS